MAVWHHSSQLKTEKKTIESGTKKHVIQQCRCKICVSKFAIVCRNEKKNNFCSTASELSHTTNQKKTLYSLIVHFAIDTTAQFLIYNNLFGHQCWIFFYPNRVIFRLIITEKLNARTNKYTDKVTKWVTLNNTLFMMQQSTIY